MRYAKSLLKSRIYKLEGSYLALAHLCGADVQYDEHTKCCGFAGNKGFSTPELNASALESFGINNQQYIFDDASKGFSSSSTCEIGLSVHTQFAWQHIVYLVDSCTK